MRWCCWNVYFSRSQKYAAFLLSHQLLLCHMHRHVLSEVAFALQIQYSPSFTYQATNPLLVWISCSQIVCHLTWSVMFPHLAALCVNLELLTIISTGTHTPIISAGTLTWILNVKRSFCVLCAESPQSRTIWLGYFWGFGISENSVHTSLWIFYYFVIWSLMKGTDQNL